MTQPDVSSADLQAMIDAATDGPWVSTYVHGWGFKHTCGMVATKDHSAKDIAGDCPIAVTKEGSSHWGTKYPFVANARLIAAAPDLAAEVIHLRAANMALVVGQAKAHAAGYAQGVKEAANICSRIANTEPRLFQVLAPMRVNGLGGGVPTI